MAEEKNDKLKKARIEMNYLTGEAEVRRLAELREKWEMDRISAINHATRKGEEKRKGRAERKSGRKEEKIEIAKELLKIGVPIDKIVQATKLSKEKIEKISKE